MSVEELETIFKMSVKMQKPIYLGYYKTISRKKGIGFIDYEKVDHIFFYTDTRYRKGRYIPIRITSKDQLKKYETIYTPLTKPDTKGITMVPIEDIFLQNPKKYKNIKILFGKVNEK